MPRRRWRSSTASSLIQRPAVAITPTRSSPSQAPKPAPWRAPLSPQSFSAATTPTRSHGSAAVRGADVVFIAVGTPSSHDGSADLSQVLTAAEQIGRAITGFTVVVTKSTVPVGTAKRIKDTVAKVTKQPFAVGSNPEFLKEG